MKTLTKNPLQAKGIGSRHNGPARSRPRAIEAHSQAAFLSMVNPARRDPGILRGLTNSVGSKS